MKQCSRCKQLKPDSEYHRNALTPTGLNYYCKTCANANRSRSYQRNKLRIDEKTKEYRRKNADKLKAHIIVNSAVHRGKLPPVSTLTCARCFEQASHYHHPSYHPSDRLNVIPLCASCHKLAHAGNSIAAQLQGGIMPTALGIVRIAITVAR